jgi:hypothetical protein
MALNCGDAGGRDFRYLWFVAVGCLLFSTYLAGLRDRQVTVARATGTIQPILAIGFPADLRILE